MSKNKFYVKDFMSHPLFSVQGDFVLEQAERVFHEYRLTAAPVLIDKKKVLGVITDFQLIKCFLVRNLKPLKARIRDFLEDLDPVYLVDENEEISHVLKLMIQSPNHRIFVTRDDVLIGALSPKDILPYLAGEEALERHAEHRDLIRARIEIKKLMSELASVKIKLDDYHQAFMSSPFMIHSADLEGNITSANPMLHQVLGYKPDELIGKKITDLYASQYHKEAMAGLSKVKPDGYHPLVHTLMVRKNKELLQIDLASSSKTNSEGEIIGAVTIGRISNSSKMIEALENIGEALKSQDVSAKIQSKV